MGIKNSYLKTYLLTIFASSILTVSGDDNNRLPNIVWITCEDMSPHLGCYGDSYARTPNLDKLAEEGVRYLNAYANSPVCTPARSTIITGVYAASLGTQHLRLPLTTHRIPEEIKCFTEYLREAGYYCSNNPKEDYNFSTPASAWDDSGKTAHWRNRKPGQKFFSVFNFSITHQAMTRYSKEELIRRNSFLPEELRHNPDDVILPPYYPDTEEIRNNLAALYTQGTLMDKRVKRILDQLKEDGLEEETIVFFYSDHGDGIPRGKRWLHETGTQIPLIIKFPKKFEFLKPSHLNSIESRMVSFIDFAPTILNILNLTIPEYMQGKPFLGDNVKTNHDPVFLFSDRIGGVVDMSRGLRNNHFRYIRNYFPYKARMPFCHYSEFTPIRKELRKLYAEDKLNRQTELLMQQNKPAEELYDLRMDPWEIKNLASNPLYQDILDAMRKELNLKMEEIGDLSFIPEAEMKVRSNGQPLYGLHKQKNKYDIKTLIHSANMVGTIKSSCLLDMLNDEDSAVRYWAVTAVSADSEVTGSVLDKVKLLFDDPNPSVRISSAEAIFIHRGFDDEAMKLILEELNSADMENKLHAVSTLEKVNINDAMDYLPELIGIYQKYGNKNDGYSSSFMKHILWQLITQLELDKY